MMCMKKKDKIIFALLYLIALISYGFILFDQYELSKVKIEDLEEVNIIFDEYVKGKNDNYHIKAKDGKVYGIESIVDKDEDLYNSLKENDEVRILYLDKGNKYYDYMTIEMYVNGNCVVSVDDYHEDYSDHMIVSIIALIGIFGGIPLFIFVIYKVGIKKIDNISIKKKIDYNKEEVIKRKEELKELIKYENGKYYADFDNEFNDDISIDILQDILFEELENEELRIIFDSNYGDEFLYCAFKYNNKLMFNIAYVDKEGVLFIDDFMLMWTNKDYSEFSLEEKELFEREFQKYGESINREAKVIKEDEE